MPKSFHLLLHKGLSPYEHVDSFQKHNGTTLPSKKLFHITPTGEGKKDRNYQHAQTVWQAFNIQNLRKEEVSRLIRIEVCITIG